MLIDLRDEHSQARRTHAETWLWDLKCFHLVLFKHRLSHTNTHHETGRQVKQKRWVGVCQVTYPLSAAERTAVSALPFVGMLVSVQHFAFQDRVSEQVSGDTLLLINAQFVVVMQLSHWICLAGYPSPSMAGSLLEGASDPVLRGFSAPPDLPTGQKNSQKPHLFLSLCFFRSWVSERTS